MQTDSDDLWEEGDEGAKGLEEMLQYYYIKKKEGPPNGGAAKGGRGRSNSVSSSPRSPTIITPSSSTRVTASPLKGSKPNPTASNVENGTPTSIPTTNNNNNNTTTTVTPITAWRKPGDGVLGNKTAEQGATSNAEQSTHPSNTTMGPASPVGGGGGHNKKYSHRLKSMVLGRSKEHVPSKSHTAPLPSPHHNTTTGSFHSNSTSTTSNTNSHSNSKLNALNEDEAKLLLDHLKKCDEELLKCDQMIKEIDEKEQELLDRIQSPSSSSSKPGGMYSDNVRASKRPGEEVKKEMHIVEAFLDHFATSDRAKRSTISRGLMVTALEDYQSPESPRFQFKKGTPVHLLDVDSKSDRYQGVIRDPTTQKNEIAWFPAFFVKVMPPSRRDKMKQRSIRRTEKKERNSSVMQELIRQAEASTLAKRKAGQGTGNGHDQASSPKASTKGTMPSDEEGQTLIVALDGSKDAFQALECCVRFANKGDRIYMVYIIEKHKDKVGNKKQQLRWNQQLQENKLMADLLMVQAKESANEATRKFHKNQIAVKGRVKTSITRKAECLCNLASTYKANYIFAGAGGDGSTIISGDGESSGGSGNSSSGRRSSGGSGGSSSSHNNNNSKGSGIMLGGLGNTSRYLLAHAHCPVLICRDEKN